MELVLISCHAIGGYSDQEHNETVLIKKESFNKIKDEIFNISVSITELDGKHSEVEADVYIEVDSKFILKNISEFIEDIKNNDGGILEGEISGIYASSDLDFGSEQKEIKEYILTLDVKIKKEIYIRERDLDYLDKFLYELDRDNNFKRISNELSDVPSD